MGGGIPDRWLDYSKTGNQIEGTQFVAFKVPLKPELTVTQTDEVKFHISELVERLPNLGMVVDLTNTDRYYNPAEFRKFDVRYYKIATKGHEIPEKRLVQQFFRVVKDFLRRSPEKLIGVHCTHGVNRTGYFICSYMIQVESLAANEAIDKFDEARGHKQERGNYLTALRLLKQASIERIEPEVRVENHPRPFRRRDSYPLRRRDTPDQVRPGQWSPYPQRIVPGNGMGVGTRIPPGNGYGRNHPAEQHQRGYRRNEDQYGNTRTRWSRPHPDSNQTNGRFGGSQFY